MQIITQELKDTLSLKETTLGQKKSQLRLDVEALEVGQIALFKNSGNDYKSYQQLYSAVCSVRRATGRQFELKQLTSKEGAVVTRTA